jgi:hypothetical protein
MSMYNNNPNITTPFEVLKDPHQNQPLLVIIFNAVTGKMTGRNKGKKGFMYMVMEMSNLST